MYNRNLILFNELADKCGNRYLAAKYLASKARNLGKQYPRSLIESKLLTWALTGEQPCSTEELHYRRVLDLDIQQLEDYLCYVDDKEVASRVRIYYNKSIHRHRLTLDEENVLDKYRQMRVNIILRMMWYGSAE